MKRKVLLMAGSFIILLLAFGTYQLFVPGVAFFDPEGRTRARPDSLKSFDGEGPNLGKTRDITIYYRDPQGRLRGVYKATAWTKEDDGSITLENPEAVVYQRDGTRVYLSGERGRFWAEEVAGGAGFNIRHGQVDGRVEIFYDQSTDDKYDGEERLHPKDRPYEDLNHDVLRIITSDVKFSRDLLELTTDSEVTLWSRQADMNGKGLLLQWNEHPRELRLLRLEKGNILVIKELGDISKRFGSKKDTPSTQPATSTARSDSKADDWGLTEKESPTTQDTADSKKEEKPVTILPDGSGEPRNIYIATCHENARLFMGDGWIKNADELSFEGYMDLANFGGKDKRRKREKDTSTSQPATAPATAPASQPTKEPKFAKSQAKKSTYLNFSDLAEDHLVIYWDGPLTVEPKGYAPNPSDKNNVIHAVGKRLIAHRPDKKASLVCEQIHIRMADESGWAKGSAKNPVRILYDNFFITVKGRLEYQNDSQEATAAGPGIFEIINNDEPISISPEIFLPEQQSFWRKVSTRVTWAEKAVLGVNLNEIDASDGEKKGLPVKDIKVYENVKGVQFAKPVAYDKEGVVTNFIKSTDSIHVWLGSSGQGKPYMERVVADGNIDGNIDENKIKADHLDVSFQPVEKGEETEVAQAKPDSNDAASEKKSTDALTTNSPEAAKVLKPDSSKSEKSGKTKDKFIFAVGDPTNIYASGNVNITLQDPKNPQQPPLRIEGDMLRASNIDTKENRGLAVLTGTPAKLWQGEQNIEGEVIRFDGEAQAVKVEGKGQMRFFTNQDLSGNRLEKPRPVEVAWGEKMLYHGQAGQCIFDRDVHFDSGGEKIFCPKEIRIFFQPKDSQAKSSQPVPKGSRAFSMGVDDFSGAKFSSIEADGGTEEKQWVRMQTQRTHPKNNTWVLQRNQIRGKQIIYNDVKGVLKVNGPGDFLAEDYQEPRKRSNEEKRLGSLNEMGGQIDRPSQTLFRWKKDMLFQQTSRYVRLRDGVEMIHRSGNKILTLPNLKTQPFRNISEGRISTLHAGQLDAWFNEPEKKLAIRDEHGRIKDARDEQGRELLEGGPDFGKLKLFKAEKDVTMQMADDGVRYGTTTIDGEKVLYDDIRKIVEVTGFPEGATKRTDAQITVEDRRAGVPPKTVRSPVLIYDLKNDVIRVPTLTGGGGR